MNPAHEPPSSQPSTETTSSSSSTSTLPPEALALAGRLFEAARRGDESGTALLEAALGRGGSGLANLTNDKGDTLIMLASYHGHADLVRLLIRHGANPNRVNDRGQSPLAGVVFKNERDCVLALLEGGADPEVGQPSALESCQIFKQEEYLNLFTEQIERLKTSGLRATNGHASGGGGSSVGDTYSSSSNHTTNGDASRT